MNKMRVAAEGGDKGTVFWETFGEGLLMNTTKNGLG